MLLRERDQAQFGVVVGPVTFRLIDESQFGQNTEIFIMNSTRRKLDNDHIVDLPRHGDAGVSSVGHRAMHEVGRRVPAIRGMDCLHDWTTEISGLAALL